MANGQEGYSFGGRLRKALDPCKLKGTLQVAANAKEAARASGEMNA